MQRFAVMRIASTVCLLGTSCSVSAFTTPTVARRYYAIRAAEPVASDLDNGLDKADTLSAPETPPVPMTLVSSEPSPHKLFRSTYGSFQAHNMT